MKLQQKNSKFVSKKKPTNKVKLSKEDEIYYAQKEEELIYRQYYSDMREMSRVKESV